MADDLLELLNTTTLTGSIDELPAMASLKKLLMIFIVDTSHSMGGARMREVNEAFRTMIPALQRVQEEVGDAFSLQIAVMRFGTEATWLAEPTPVMDYLHHDITANGGKTCYGNMLDELERKLSASAFMAHEGKIAQPYIMLLTDGAPNDTGYAGKVERLRENHWFRQARRYAVLIGKEAAASSKARKMVESFVDEPTEAILTVSSAQEIVESVSAKTLHTVRNMTRHVVGSTEEAEFPNARGGNPEMPPWNFPEGSLTLPEDSVF